MYHIFTSDFMHGKQKKLSQFLPLTINIFSSGLASAFNSIRLPQGLEGSL